MTLKSRFVSLALLAVLLAVVPAVAQNDLYDNGPIDGDTDAWTINFGFAVSDSFTLSTASTVNGLEFGSWLFPGDVLDSVQVQITSSEFGGTTFTDQVVNLTASNCFTNQFDFNVCTESGTFATPVNLAAGTYWLTLQNACCTVGDPFYWDENSGPSSASESSVGTIPSESFTLLGSSTSTTSTTSTVPEPGGMLLLASGILAMTGVLRRKMM